jgi:GTP diphosphokinase / guanosine-3',5'-bis(diphosphate) 3'-diphosphatase
MGNDDAAFRTHTEWASTRPHDIADEIAHDALHTPPLDSMDTPTRQTGLIHGDENGTALSTATGAPPAGLSLVVQALSFAAEKHRGQLRKGVQGRPFINHPIELVRILQMEGGITDPVTLAAGFLHDTVEDTPTTVAEIEARFGPDVARVVAEVTDDPKLPKQEQRRMQIVHAPYLSDRARAVKLADKVCNLREILAEPPKGWNDEKKRFYFDWAKRVVDALRGRHPALEAAFDEVYGRLT